eukprot:5154806-Amphidinium_carterae.1
MRPSNFCRLSNNPTIREEIRRLRSVESSQNSQRPTMRSRRIARTLMSARHTTITESFPKLSKSQSVHVGSKEEPPNKNTRETGF